MQRHLDHFRDAKLYREGELILEQFEGYIGCREKSGHRKEWHGYFLVSAREHLDPESKYTLELSDGSKATIRGSDISSCESDGGEKHAVEFYVVGDIRGGSRRSIGLEHSGRRPLG
ncbi:hypothetical protein [Tautonia plasticadhaerens]|uniref:Uncharacterized protein n=1 Tax=Tautonia plasticadhaerens TaxID=2527974 RepID=A0A518H8S2_9BACT|nr:hypothetical protein [Tautonia plasticadhaerens]QDV37239.1 hypothetical protein ElP_51740 [Tautonia plasticadhaerens]